jgi:preprotein translocase subunit YajC
MLDMLAAGSANAGMAPYMQFLPIIGMVIIFWFLLFRPQMKRQKEHAAKVAAVKVRDLVLTAGGIEGKVTKVEDNYVEVEIAKDVRVRVVKTTLTDITPHAANPAND